MCTHLEVSFFSASCLLGLRHEIIFVVDFVAFHELPSDVLVFQFCIFFLVDDIILPILFYIFALVLLVSSFLFIIDTFFYLGRPLIPIWYPMFRTHTLFLYFFLCSSQFEKPSIVSLISLVVPNMDGSEL